MTQTDTQNCKISQAILFGRYLFGSYTTVIWIFRLLSNPKIILSSISYEQIPLHLPTRALLYHIIWNVTKKLLIKHEKASHVPNQETTTQFLIKFLFKKFRFCCLTFFWCQSPKLWCDRPRPKMDHRPNAPCSGAKFGSAQCDGFQQRPKTFAYP